MGFTKLDEHILQSSIMSEGPITFKVWITLLAACEQNGVARVSSVFLGSVCHLPMSKIDAAIMRLEAPDPHSRSLADEGRRIRRVDGGYEIINYCTYRESSLRDAEAERKRLYRQDKRECPDKSGRSPDASASASVSSSASIFLKEGEWGGITETDMGGWAKAYPACDINRELAAMIEWIKANPAKGKKANYRRFVINWLSRSQERGGGMRSVSPREAEVSRSLRVGARPDPSPEEKAKEREKKKEIDLATRTINDRYEPQIDAARAAGDIKGAKALMDAKGREIEKTIVTIWGVEVPIQKGENT